MCAEAPGVGPRGVSFRWVPFTWPGKTPADSRWCSCLAVNYLPGDVVGVGRGKRGRAMLSHAKLSHLHKNVGVSPGRGRRGESCQRPSPPSPLGRHTRSISTSLSKLLVLFIGLDCMIVNRFGLRKGNRRSAIPI